MTAKTTAKPKKIYGIILVPNVDYYMVRNNIDRTINAGEERVFLFNFRLV